MAFTATSGAHTIAAGSSSFATLDIDSTGGNLTVTEHATATNAITLTDAGSFTVNSGITLESTGTFSNALQNASTTWSGSTLRLAGSDHTINSKTNEGRRLRDAANDRRR